MKRKTGLADSPFFNSPVLTGSSPLSGTDSNKGREDETNEGRQKPPRSTSNPTRKDTRSATSEMTKSRDRSRDVSRDNLRTNSRGDSGEKPHDLLHHLPTRDEVQGFSFRLRDELKVKVQAEVPHTWQKELEEISRALNVKKLELYRFVLGEFLGKVRRGGRDGDR